MLKYGSVKKIIYIYFMLILPGIIAALRIGCARAWRSIISSEAIFGIVLLLIFIFHSNTSYIAIIAMLIQGSRNSIPVTLSSMNEKFSSIQNTIFKIFHTIFVLSSQHSI